MPTPAWTVYQPLIVGLGAVVLGLVANTLLEWFRHSLSVGHRKAGTRRALLAELRIARATAENNAENASPTDPNKSMIMLMPIREQYPAFDWAKDSLGLLSQDEIYAVFKAYDHLRSWPEIVALVGRLERVDGRLFGHVGTDHWMTISATANNHVRLLNEAIATIETHLN